MIRLFKDLSDTERKNFYASDLWDRAAGDFYFHPLNIEYSLEYFGRDLQDHSVVVYSGTKPMLCYFAFTKSKELTYFHWPVQTHRSPTANADEINMAYRELITHIEEQAASHKIESVFFYEDAYLACFFSEKIISSSPQQHAMVELSLSVESIKSNVRRRYKSFINWGEKNLKTIILDKNNADEKLFYSYKNFHIDVSGRQTRNDRTWEIQFEMLKSGLTFLVLCYLDDKLVSGVLIPHGTRTAFYGVGVNNRKLMAENMPIGHYPIYASILHAKKIGLHYYHLNKIDYTRNDPKLRNIAHFKAGFTATFRTVIANEVRFITSSSDVL